jgi:multiple sugar transport system ATP-binding protein
MNFVEGQVEARDGAPAFVAEGIHLALPADSTARPGQTLTCGVRPADLVLSGDGPIAGDLVLAEKTGADLNLHLSIAGQDFVATAPRDAAVTPGAPVRFTVDPGKVHLFDPETGRRV